MGGIILCTAIPFLFLARHAVYAAASCSRLPNKCSSQNSTSCTVDRSLEMLANRYNPSVLHWSLLDISSPQTGRQLIHKTYIRNGVVAVNSSTMWFAQGPLMERNTFSYRKELQVFEKRDRVAKCQQALLKSDTLSLDIKYFATFCLHSIDSQIISILIALLFLWKINQWFESPSGSCLY